MTSEHLWDSLSLTLMDTVIAIVPGITSPLKSARKRERAPAASVSLYQETKDFQEVPRTHPPSTDLLFCLFGLNYIIWPKKEK